MPQRIDLDRPVKLAEGVYWVGFADSEGRLQCNPYLILDEGEAILIDGGSRPDFSTVMRKVLQTGIKPKQISHLIYQHYDPDLCGSIPNLESLIDSSDLKIISQQENIPFIKHYSTHSPLLCIDRINQQLTLKSGRILRFYRTPYAHSAGSFITFDQQSGILFTSDLFGSFSHCADWSLFSSADLRCQSCTVPLAALPEAYCEEVQHACPWKDMHNFHKRIMPNTRSVRFAMKIVRSIAPTMLAPQHGHIIREAGDIEMAISRLESMNDIGIDGIPEANGL